MKATARAITNIKPMAGGVAIAQLQVGWYVYGDKGTTDILNFDHYYKVSGERVNLGVPCKAFIGTNLVLSDETEPVIEEPVEYPIGTLMQTRYKLPTDLDFGAWKTWERTQ